MERPLPQNRIRTGQIVYLVESGRRVREVRVLERAGTLYTVRFTDTGGGIRVRGDRLCLTRDDAAAQVQQAKARQPVLASSCIWHNVPVWQC